MEICETLRFTNKLRKELNFGYGSSSKLFTIDLFGLYILFSHFRPRDANRRNSFFQMSSYARANLRITNEKQKENSHEGITWSEMGKQNVQAEKVYLHEDQQINKLFRFMGNGSRYRHTHYAIAFIVISIYVFNFNYLRLKSAIKCIARL